MATEAAGAGSLKLLLEILLEMLDLLELQLLEE